MIFSGENGPVKETMALGKIPLGSRHGISLSVSFFVRGVSSSLVNGISGRRVNQFTDLVFRQRSISRKSSLPLLLARCFDVCMNPWFSRAAEPMECT